MTGFALSDQYQMTNNTPNKPGLVSGKIIIGVSLAVPVLVCLAGVWIVTHPIEAQTNEPLVWSQRADWLWIPLRDVMLEKYPGPRPLFDDPQRDKVYFQIEPAELNVVLQSSTLASLQPIDLAGLTKLAEQNPKLFYPAYLTNAEPDTAIALAPAILCIPLVDDADRPLVNYQLDSIEIFCASMRDDVIDTSLRLVYPNPVSDSQGRIYLPVYNTVLRLSDSNRWFEFPGRLGIHKPIRINSKH